MERNGAVETIRDCLRLAIACLSKDNIIELMDAAEKDPAVKKAVEEHKKAEQEKIKAERIFNKAWADFLVKPGWDRKHLYPLMEAYNKAGKEYNRTFMVVVREGLKVMLSRLKELRDGKPRSSASVEAMIKEMFLGAMARNRMS